MAGLQAELTATKQMNTELQRLLEANHLKHRIQHDALTNLHCQTIKVPWALAAIAVCLTSPCCELTQNKTLSD